MYRPRSLGRTDGVFSYTSLAAFPFSKIVYLTGISLVIGSLVGEGEIVHGIAHYLLEVAKHITDVGRRSVGSLSVSQHLSLCITWG